MSTPKVLVFGPQSLEFDGACFVSLRQKLHSDPSYRWLVEVLAALPITLAEWSTVTAKTQLIDVHSHLELVVEALQTGQDPPDFFSLPNALLSPLVAVSQLADYITFIKTVEPTLSGDTHLPTAANAAETLGLCTGILTAFAVACSANTGDLIQYGAAAVRLAMLTGALVDAEDASRDFASKSVSFSVSWTEGSLSDLEKLLSTYPESYVSVRMDEKRATVTCAQSAVPEVLQILRDAGKHVSVLALSGRFHWPFHHPDMEQLLQFVDTHSELQMMDSAHTVIPTRSNNGRLLATGNLHEIALNAILIDQSNWYQTVKAALTDEVDFLNREVLCFGTERCLPPSLARDLKTRQLAPKDKTLPAFTISPVSNATPTYPDDRIAVIGMACHMPNAEDLDSFWDVLLSGQSQHREIPPDRFIINAAARGLDPTTKWYGNFINEPDAFDHKFFKKSPREMSSTDPQHRIALQLAYQAVQQSGYYSASGSDTSKHIGVYIGHANTDYEHNIRAHPANAYSATGNLKSLLAGKISHYFGWTGPSLTLDTACSSSSVAIHLACRAILSGEIDGALAGGVNVLTSPEWYYNLAGASFLSTSGQCKAFDASADGYCRGEGSGMVLMKKLSTALADGDQILGVIAATSVLQNQNCTPITVPNSVSLADLFQGVVKQARMKPHDISVVEAHGTGTPVGDPAEYDGIRQVFGGPTRPDRLFLTAVKGSIGHLEVASGVASLIKILLMMQEATVPAQASFNAINPDLKARPDDRIDITTTCRPWPAPSRAALINNYGASGSNASMVVLEAPKEAGSPRALISQLAECPMPFWFSGFDENSLKRYAAKMRAFLQRKIISGGEYPAMSLVNLSYQLARQSNHTLAQGLVLTASSVDELIRNLSHFEDGVGFSSFKAPTRRPVIMCFGGQMSTFIGLDQNLFSHVTILRQHLEACDAVCLELGLESIFPDIFQRAPLSDTVKLHTALFATQYSCAMTWIDCGVEVSAIVGHSFGELTGLCVAGAMSLVDALKMISGRAKLLQQKRTTDRGSMMAVEGDLAAVENLVAMASVNSRSEVSIACYNTPTTYTLAGSTAAIKTAEQLAKMEAMFSGMRVKILNVAGAFHCSLVDPIASDLELLGQEITFHAPKIHIERATEHASPRPFYGQDIARHLRNPVYFHHAVKRLSDRYGDAIWLEAGSNSMITNMASKVLGNTGSSFFQPVNITMDASFSSLVDTTANLWRQGLRTRFWIHHKAHSSDYASLLLPPYQFEKSRHWLDIKDVPVQKSTSASGTSLTSFFGFIDHTRNSMRFRVHSGTKEFTQMVEAHVMANTAGVMPGMLPAQLVIDSVSSLQSQFRDSTYQPELRDVAYHSPLVPQHCVAVWLDVEVLDSEGLTWEWKILGEDARKTSTQYISGLLIYSATATPSAKADFARLSRMASYRRCKSILDRPEKDKAITGSKIYTTFDKVIDYKAVFRHLVKLVGRDGDTAGRVMRAHEKEGWIDSVLTDCFCQVAGIGVNLFSEDGDLTKKGIFIGDRIERWVKAPGPKPTNSSMPREWDVMAFNHRESETTFISDVFAFDARNGSLHEAVLGIRYSRVPLPAIRRVLSSRMTGDPAPRFSNETAAAQPNGVTNGIVVNGDNTTQPTTATATRLQITAKSKEILQNLSGVEVEDIRDDSDLIDMGIDSLMAMELIREVDASFKCKLVTDQLMQLTDFKSLVDCIGTAMGVDMDEAMGVEVVTNGDGTADDVNRERHDSIHANSIKTEMTVEEALIPATLVQNVLRATTALTDEFIMKHNLDAYCSKVRPRSTMLCAAYIIEAFEKLGCSLKTALPSELLEMPQYLPKRKNFMAELLKIIGPEETRLVEFMDGTLVRTSTACPTETASELLEAALRDEPDHAPEFKLAALTGSKLAECLTGEAEGLHLIFGTAEGRKTVSDVYAVAPINYAWIDQAVFFLRQLLRRLPQQRVNILEVGAGTGGTTGPMVEMLEALAIPVTYTFTDLSSSLVAAARKRFKKSSFVEFRVVNIESAPEKDLLHSQHIILANACVHATRSLPISLHNIRQMLRPDGMLLLLEETEQLPWVDFVFGLLEGWWLFEDGRTHAQVSAEHWKNVLYDAGFGHVSYTDGKCPEARVQRIIFGFTEDVSSGDDLAEQTYPGTLTLKEMNELDVRQKTVDEFVGKYTADYKASLESPHSNTLMNGVSSSERIQVLVTGATGSLGSHLASMAAKMPNVAKVVCLNRAASVDVVTRQQEAFTLRGIDLEPSVQAKLEILATDTSKPKLGLPTHVYDELVRSTTHISHSAWPMSLTRTTIDYKPQFQTMRNLIDLAQQCVECRPADFQFSFQFISSIGTMGYLPLWSGKTLVPEETPATCDTALPVGYADAKIVCERMLESTLRLHPDQFRASSVRIAQITGSRSNGYWNPMEHFPFLLKSAQYLKSLPSLQGTLTWLPVDDLAASLLDISLSTEAMYPVYQMENPVRQPWPEMIAVLAKELDVPREGVVSYEQWLKKVRSCDAPTAENPAKQLIDFWEKHFLRMSTGPLVLNTTKSREHSSTMREVTVVDENLVRKFVEKWKESGFLK